MSHFVKVTSDPLKGSPAEIFTHVGHFLFKNVDFPLLKSARWVEVPSGHVGRELTLQNGDLVLEELLHYCKNESTYKYSIIESKLPVTNYTAVYKVEKIDNATCRLVWTAKFDSDADGIDNVIGNDIFGPVVKGINAKYAA
eukprot:Nk52_evm39s2579 gene=Nk52_evmTU39s2579